MEDIKIVNEVMPVIEINFDVMKAALTEKVSFYEGLIVTEESLKVCKEEQKELAALRRQIDTYRKDKKKELSEPITRFENQCKELIGIIDKVEKPIKEGIAFFDDKRRAEKRAQAEAIAAEVAEETGLNEEFAARLTVIDKYCNLTAKKSDVQADLELRAIALKQEQDREEELLKIMVDTLEYENQKIQNKLQLKEFVSMAKRGYSTSEVIQQIKKRAEEIYKIENPPAPVEQPEPAPEAQEAPAPSPAAEPEPEEIFYAIYKISGAADQLRSVSDFLRKSGIVYRVEKQGRV